MAEKDQHKEKLYHRIERYLRQEMTHEERLEFESELDQNQSLKDELAIHQDVHRTFGIADEGRVRKKLASAADRWEERTSGSVVKNMWPLRKLIGLAAMLVMGIGFVMWLNTNPREGQVADQFDVYPMLLNQRSLADTAEFSRLLTKAIQGYNKRDFNKAAEDFKRLSELQEEAITYQFYEAVCRLGNDEYTRAINLFEKLVTKENHLLQQQARWYLGVAYHNSGKTEEAINIFQQIKPGEYNYDRIK